MGTANTYIYTASNATCGFGTTTTLQMQYGASGNITSKNDAALTLVYGKNPQIHQLTSLTGAQSSVPTTKQNITYYSFRKVKQISEGIYKYNFTYDAAEQRNKMEYRENSILKYTRYYSGAYEVDTTAGSYRRVYYIYTPAGLTAMYVKRPTTDSLYYLHTDHLGSITMVTNANGAIAESFSYDAWGRRRNPTDLSYTNVPQPRYLSRGYTGHEHLAGINLINMNGRVYDPLMGMFLSPDPVLQSPNDPLNYNRYSYCLNNPLKYTDPSGEFIFTALLPGAGVFIDAALWGAVIGGITGGIQADMNGGSFWNGAWKGALVGAVGGSMGAGFAQLGVAWGVSGVLPGMAYGAATGATTGAVTGGMSTSLNGGSFWDGASQGALFGAAFGSLGGGISSGNDAFQKGNNVWWGTEPEKWAHNRGQWSLGWWDSPDVASSTIRSVSGEFAQGCIPTGMESIAKSYGLYDQDQYFWKSRYENFTGEKFDGVNPNKFENFIESVNGYKVDAITKDNVFSSLNSGKRVGIAINNYGQNGGNHFMVVKTMKIWPNGNFKITLMNPDGGGRYFINQRNYLKYGARIWSIYR